MKINNVLSKAQLLIVNGESDKRNVAEKYSGMSVPQSGDSVNISRLIGYLNQMMVTNASSQAGSDKVAMLKSGIEAGTYTVSGMAVASKMLGIERLS